MTCWPSARSQHEGRRPDYHRAPADFGAVGVLVRIATCISGRVEVVVNCAPLFNYGTAGGTWSYTRRRVRRHDGRPGGGGRAAGAGGQHPARRAGCPRLRPHHAHRGPVGLRGAVLGGRDRSRPARTRRSAALNTTVDFWRDWLSAAKIPDHPWKPYLDRSALTLKALSYAPTGAIMAAATTSLPETPGGERNWDYRFTWIRDSSFMLRSLYRLGFDWEAIEYFGFVLDAVTGGDLNRPPELQIMYGIGGERDLTERTLDHLSGYAGARPVRVGNGAWNQHQHDVWGMILDALDVQFHRAAEPDRGAGVGGARRVRGRRAGALARARPGDLGGPRRAQALHRVQGDVLGRGRARRRPGRRTRRRRTRQAVAGRRRQDQGRGARQGRVRTGACSASTTRPTTSTPRCCCCPSWGSCLPTTSAIKATVLAIADELTEDGLVLRYRVEGTDTGFSGEEGTFTICSFWLVTALAMIGETDRARALCQKLLSFAGPLQLYAEEIDATTGQHLGNFPQAFTHLALIDAVSLLIGSEQEGASGLQPVKAQPGHACGTELSGATGLGHRGASFRHVPCSGSYSSRSNTYMSSPSRMSE